MKSLSKNVIFNVIYNVLNMFFPLATSMYVSRVLGPDGVGVVSYAQNIASYFVMFAALGMPVHGVREIAKAMNDQEETNRVFSELFIINFVATTVCTIVYLFLIFGVHNFSKDYVLFLCCGLQILFNYINIDWFYQGKEEYVYIVCRSIVIKILALLSIVFLVRTKNDYMYYALVSSFALGGNYIFNVIHARKFVKFTRKGLKIKRHMRPVAIFAINTILYSIYTRVDITMLGVMTSDTATGLYTNASKIIIMITAACISISAVFLPRLSYLFQDDRKSFENLLKFGGDVLSFLTIPSAVGLFMLAPQFMELLFGREFLGATATVRIFAVLIIVKGFGDLFGYQLVIATGHEKDRLWASVWATVINIALNAALIPIGAHNGAAIASVFSELTVSGYQIFKMREFIPFNLIRKPFMQAVISSAVMGVGVYMVTLFRRGIWFDCIVGVIVGASIYLVINLIMKNEFLMNISSKIHFPFPG